VDGAASVERTAACLCPRRAVRVARVTGLTTSRLTCARQHAGGVQRPSTARFAAAATSPRRPPLEKEQRTTREAPQTRAAARTRSFKDKLSGRPPAAVQEIALVWWSRGRRLLRTGARVVHLLVLQTPFAKRRWSAPAMPCHVTGHRGWVDHPGLIIRGRREGGDGRAGGLTAQAHRKTADVPPRPGRCHRRPLAPLRRRRRGRPGIATGGDSVDRRGRPPWVPQQCCQPLGVTPHAGDPRPYGGGQRGPNGSAGARQGRSRVATGASVSNPRWADSRPPTLSRQQARPTRGFSTTPRACRCYASSRGRRWQRGRGSQDPQNPVATKMPHRARTREPPRPNSNDFFFSPLLRQYGHTHATAATGQCGAGGVEYVNAQHNHSSLQQTARRLRTECRRRCAVRCSRGPAPARLSEDRGHSSPTPRIGLDRVGTRAPEGRTAHGQRAPLASNSERVRPSCCQGC